MDLYVKRGLSVEDSSVEKHYICESLVEKIFL